jgi:hypothetical protein
MPSKRRGRKSSAKSLRRAAAIARVPFAIPSFSEPLGKVSNNFALANPMTPGTMYLGGRASTGSVTTKSELGIQVVDFFNYGVLDPAAGGIPQDVTNYFWNINQNLFNNAPTATTDKTQTFCRVRKLEVYVLPLKGLNFFEENAPNDSNADAMYTVNAQVPGVSLTQGTTFSPAVAADTQVTNILPQFDTFWKKVLTCNLDKTFSSGVMRPYFSEGTQRTDQCLFQMSIRDPTTGNPYLPSDETAANPLSIRVKVVMHIDQPIAPTQNAELRVFRNEDFSRPSTAQNGTPYAPTRPQYVQMNLSGRLDKFR